MKAVWLVFAALFLSSCVQQHWDTFFRVKGEIVNEDGSPLDWCWIELRQAGSNEAPWGNKPRRVRSEFNKKTFIGQFESSDILFLEITCDYYNTVQRTETFRAGPAIANYPEPYDTGKIVMKKITGLR